MGPKYSQGPLRAPLHGAQHVQYAAACHPKKGLWSSRLRCSGNTASWAGETIFGTSPFPGSVGHRPEARWCSCFSCALRLGPLALTRDYLAAAIILEARWRCYRRLLALRRASTDPVGLAMLTVTSLWPPDWSRLSPKLFLMHVFTHDLFHLCRTAVGSLFMRTECCSMAAANNMSHPH